MFQPPVKGWAVWVPRPDAHLVPQSLQWHDCHQETLNNLLEVTRQLPAGGELGSNSGPKHPGRAFVTIPLSPLAAGRTLPRWSEEARGSVAGYSTQLLTSRALSLVPIQTDRQKHRGVPGKSMIFISWEALAGL